MRYTEFILLLSILLAGCGKESTEPEEPIFTIVLTPSVGSISVGQAGNVTLRVEDLDVQIFGVSMRIGYDSTVISFAGSTGFSAGDFFGEKIVVFVRNESSVIHVTLTLTQGQETVVGSGELGEFTFKGVSPGSSRVEIIPSELHFYDSGGSDVLIDSLVIENANVIVQ